MQEPHARPLVLGLEGALLRSNLSVEAALGHIRAHPSQLLQLATWAARGRDHLARQLAMLTVDADALPLDDAVVAFARTAAEQGRPVYVEAGNHPALAAQVAHRLPFVAGVIANREQAHGEPPPAYAAADCIPGPHPARELLAGLRLHQWVKNALVFVPITLAGKLTDLSALTDTILACVALCLIASATYLVNDIWDLADDRRHWSKRERPLASGRLAFWVAGLAIPTGLVLGFALAALVSPQVVTALLAYLAVTIAYSFLLKRIPLVDGFVLATLFAIRLMIGVAAAQVPPSPWLFVFAMFLFASLGYAKRHTEIARGIGRRGGGIGTRGYRAVDAPLVLAMGVGTGIAAILVLVLYIMNDAYPQSFYANPIALWALPPLLFLFVSRTWLVCQRGEMDDDPVAFALRDAASLALLGLMIGSFALAWLGTGWI